VLGRRGARPFNLEELHRLYLHNGQLYTVSDNPPGPASNEPSQAKHDEQPAMPSAPPSERQNPDGASPSHD
jgi:hypothetical protein